MWKAISVSKKCARGSMGRNNIKLLPAILALMLSVCSVAYADKMEEKDKAFVADYMAMVNDVKQLEKERALQDATIRAIIGESGSSYDEMLGIACAIKNRDSLKGVYGAKHVVWRNNELVRLHPKTGAIIERITGNTLQRASKALNEAYHGPDVTGGATHWLSDYDLKHLGNNAKWRFKMKQTAYYGTTHFYKEG